MNCTEKNTNNYVTLNNLMSYAFFLEEVIPFQSYSEAEFELLSVVKFGSVIGSIY